MTTRRRQRLPLTAYEIEGSAWHVTVDVARRNGAPFQNIMFAREILECVSHACERDEAVLHLICVMPDHLHALIEVRTVDLIKVVGRAKSATSRIWWGRGGAGALWQQSFYDRGIRASQDFETTMTYILDNPVKAGLVEEWEHYPPIGGTIIADW